MSTLRTIGDFPRNESGYVDRFIGTAYDTVKKVSDNLEQVLKVPDAVDDVLAAQQDVDAKAVQVTNNAAEVASTLVLVKSTASAAMAASKLYPTVQAGLDATTDGEYFVVAGPNNGEVFSTLYVNKGGNPDEVNTYPSTSGAWDRKNHTGVQPIASVDGLKDELNSLSEGISENETAIGEKVDKEGLAANTGAGLVGYNDSTVAATLTSILESVTDFGDKFAKYPDVKNLGAKGDGVTDDTQYFTLAVPMLLVPPGTYVIAESTITAQLILCGGAILKFTGKVTFSNPVNLPNEQVAFSGTTPVLPNNFISLGWFDIAKDGTQDVGPVMNDLIAGSSDSGRTIYIPPAASYLIDTTITIGDQNYLIICGDGRGERSNLDYTLAEPQGPGLTNSVVWPGGGPRFVLSPTVSIGISVPAPNDNAQYPRITGLNLRGFMVVGNRDATVTQTAISIERDNDTTNIVDVGVINVQTTTDSVGLDIRAADSAVIRGFWCAESINAIKVHNSNDMLITNCSLGAKASGVAFGADTTRRLTFTGNTIYPDGFTAISLLTCRYCVFSGNTITSRFTGVITLYASYGNIFSDLYIKNPADEVTDWVTPDKQLWSGTNYDPKNRDELYGIIYLDQTSNDNMFSNIQLWSWMDNVASCGIRIKGGASGNRLTNIKLVGSAAFIASPNGIVIEGLTNTVNYALDCGVVGQHTIGTGGIARYLPTVSG